LLPTRQTWHQDRTQLAETGDEAEAVTTAGTVLGRWLGESLIAAFD